MLTRLFVEVPLLLRDYLAQCSAEFLSGRSETYGQLVSRLLQSRHDVAFISLNYDTLLEQAVSAFTQRRFAGLDDYVNRAPLVLKPHGSVNWSWLFPRPSNDNVPRFLDRLAGLPIVDGGRTKGASLSVYSDSERSDPRPAYTWFEGEQLRVHVQNDTGRDPVWAYPAVTAPLAGKSARDLVPPSGHFQALARFQRECHRYLFIGTAAWDRHVLETLGAAAADSISLHVVNNDASRSGLGSILSRIESGLQVGRTGRQLTVRSVVYTASFREWVNSSAFDALLAA